MKKFIMKNAVAIVALAIASVSLMSFKTELKSSANQTFGMQVENRGQSNEIRTWVPLDALTEDLDYECSNSSEICKGEFTPEQIDPSTELPYNDAVPSNPTRGNFELIH